MKSVILSAVAALTLSSTAVLAGGLADPVVEAPIAVPAVDLSWTGFYAGLSANTDDELDNGEVGVFGGYRYDLGNVVVGGELNVVDGNDTYYSAEAQLGYDAGRFLPYASVGYFDAGSNDGEVYGIGLDYSFDNSVLVGVKYTNDEFSFNDGGFSFRVGFEF